MQQPADHPDPTRDTGCPAITGTQAAIVCFGGATIDRAFRASAPMRRGTSNPATGSRGFGGVAHNVAANLSRLGVATSLVSRIGIDANGAALITHLETLGIESGGIARSATQATAEYIAVLDPDRSLAFGIADMAIFEDIASAELAALERRCAGAAWIFADCNLPAEVFAALVHARSGAKPSGGPRLAVDVVSMPKASRLPQRLAGIDLLFLNLDEAASLLGREAVTPEDAVAALRGRGAAAVVVTLGADGVALGGADASFSIVEAVPAKVTDVTGAGDALIAAMLWSLLGRRGAMLDRANLVEAARWGSLAAALTIERDGSVDPALSAARLADRRRSLAATAVTES
jgi:pseudouridine kinase